MPNFSLPVFSCTYTFLYGGLQPGTLLQDLLVMLIIMLHSYHCLYHS